jgi:hypothetical protein
LQAVEKEMQRTYDLYQREKLDADGFSKFYEPLKERQKQIRTAIPTLEAELDILKVQSLSAEEIAAQAGIFPIIGKRCNPRKSGNSSKSSRIKSSWAKMKSR